MSGGRRKPFSDSLLSRFEGLRQPAGASLPGAGVAPMMRPLAGSVPPIAIYILGWTTSFAIAIAVHFALERPVIRLRKRFGSRGHEDRP